MTWQKLQQPRIEHVGRPIGAVAACTGTPVDVEAAPAHHHHCFVSVAARTRAGQQEHICICAPPAGLLRVDMDTGGFTGRQTLTRPDQLTWTCIDRSVDVDGGGT